jgi:hypothetical protein
VKILPALSGEPHLFTLAPISTLFLLRSNPSAHAAIWPVTRPGTTAKHSDDVTMMHQAIKFYNFIACASYPVTFLAYYGPSVRSLWLHMRQTATSCDTTIVKSLKSHNILCTLDAQYIVELHLF